MTFAVHFFAEQAFLGFVKAHLTDPPEENDLALARGAICAICLACAMESFVNRILKDHSTVSLSQRRSLAWKIKKTCEISGVRFDAKNEPFKSMLSLIELRNWLVHFKDHEIGLIGSDGTYLVTDYWGIPEHDVDRELNVDSVKEYYNRVRELAIMISDGLGLGFEFEYLKTEDYYAFLLR